MTDEAIAVAITLGGIGYIVGAFFAYYAWGG